jgi:hypothetical protein
MEIGKKREGLREIKKRRLLDREIVGQREEHREIDE